MKLDKLKHFFSKIFGNVKPWARTILPCLSILFVIAFALLYVTRPFITKLQVDVGIPEQNNQYVQTIYLFTVVPVGVAIEELIRYGLLIVFQRVGKKIGLTLANVSFLVVATLWNGYVHQTSNVVTADLSGIIAYTSIHLVLGLCFAWLILKKGFATTFTVHYLYDFLLMYSNIWM